MTTLEITERTAVFYMTKQDGQYKLTYARIEPGEVEQRAQEIENSPVFQYWFRDLRPQETNDVE